MSAFATKTEKILAALERAQWKEDADARTTKYRQFSRPGKANDHMYVGKTGALRKGKTVRDSIPVNLSVFLTIWAPVTDQENAAYQVYGNYCIDKGWEPLGVYAWRNRIYNRVGANAPMIEHRKAIDAEHAKHVASPPAPPPKRAKVPQIWQAALRITQQCDEDMTEEQLLEWLQGHFNGSDYGKVEVRLVTKLRVLKQGKGDPVIVPKE